MYNPLTATLREHEQVFYSIFNKADQCANHLKDNWSPHVSNIFKENALISTAVLMSIGSKGLTSFIIGSASANIFIIPNRITNIKIFDDEDFNIKVLAVYIFCVKYFVSNVKDKYLKLKSIGIDFYKNYIANVTKSDIENFYKKNHLFIKDLFMASVINSLAFTVIFAPVTFISNLTVLPNIIVATLSTKLIINITKDKIEKFVDLNNLRGSVFYFLCAIKIIQLLTKKSFVYSAGLTGLLLPSCLFLYFINDSKIDIFNNEGYNKFRSEIKDNTEIQQECKCTRMYSVFCSNVDKLL